MNSDSFISPSCFSSSFPLFRQELPFSCGAAAVRQVLHFVGISLAESQIRAAIKTDSKGTHSENSFNFLKKSLSNREVNIIKNSLEGFDFEKNLRWINYISGSNLLYCGGDFICGGRRGRHSHRHHAFTVNNGLVYDPAEKEVFPLNCYFHTFNKSLQINSIILVGKDKTK